MIEILMNICLKKGGGTWEKHVIYSPRKGTNIRKDYIRVEEESKIWRRKRESRVI